ncbi:AAA family ATPase [Vulgatibacter incomptus]|uniref:MoxR-like ATPase n=1 Tax=Vulgatibacter incomptus TaxID=1391653 RepID=A0A0K1P9K0_9BACT|nr:MoxR family ATPase [Vulgatibacter incomptus]AKU90106.1 MoxR-like ATPase [Vulgatibacter incomptus]
MIPSEPRRLRFADQVPSPLSPAEARALRERVIANVERALFGKRDAIELCLAGLAARGHLLIEDLPGVGKSTLALGLARSLDLPFARIQFTSDLLPSDILGLSTWDAKSASFTFRPGPIFHSVILADELNRTPPRTQSALLEAMAEGQVTLDGRTTSLPDSFFVLATVNPREQHGTYPLPESQLDRFLLRLTLGYPDSDSERRLLLGRREEEPVSTLGPVASADDVLRLQLAAARVRLDPSIADYVLAIAAESRSSERFSLGLSTRGALALASASRGLAILSGRDYVVPADVKRVAPSVLSHRLVAAGADAFDSDRGEAARLVEELLARIPVPE